MVTCLLTLGLVTDPTLQQSCDLAVWEMPVNLECVSIEHVSVKCLSHGLTLAKKYEILAFILALSVYLPKVPYLQEWTV